MTKTKFAIVVSKKDPAGLNIAEELKELGINPIIIEEDNIYAEELDKRNPKLKEADFIIFATKHQSAKEVHSLTIHAPGNPYNKAEAGGSPRKVCSTSGMFMKLLLNILKDETEKEGLDKIYDVTLEATHHGPLLNKPCCFIEIGSTEKQWKEKKPAKVIATTIKRAINNLVLNGLSDYETCIGIGGPHYCPAFTKLQLNSKYALSHIIPEYALPTTKEIIQETIKKTIEPVTKVILDWKGCGKSKERQELIDLIKSMNLEVLRTDQIEK